MVLPSRAKRDEEETLEKSQPSSVTSNNSEESKYTIQEWLDNSEVLNSPKHIVEGARVNKEWETTEMVTKQQMLDAIKEWLEKEA